MLRLLILAPLLVASSLLAEEPQKFRLAAPAGWGGETIELPPGFAPDMQLKGHEHIRFAPGMMQADAKAFFCYAFVFELETQPALTEAVLKAEFLKYYRGLSQAVLNGKPSEIPPADFTLDLKRVEEAAAAKIEGVDTTGHIVYTGKLTWVEPFATRRRQTLNLELRTWSKGDHNYLFVCVSPQDRDAPIWKQLRTIRDDYLKK